MLALWGYLDPPCGCRGLIRGCLYIFFSKIREKKVQSFTHQRNTKRADFDVVLNLYNSLITNKNRTSKQKRMRVAKTKYDAASWYCQLRFSLVGETAMIMDNKRSSTKLIDRTVGSVRGFILKNMLVSIFIS